VIQKLNRGLIPTCIVRVGGPIKPDIGKELPEDWPNPNFLPETLPILYIYNYTRKEFLQLKSFSIKSTISVGNLGDIRRSIEDSQNQERFIFTIIIIGLLSIAVVILEIFREKDNKS